MTNISKEAVEIFKANNVIISLSLYKPMIPNSSKLEEFLQTNSLKYDVNHTTKFCKAFNPKGTSDPNAVVKTCIGAYCTFLSPGHISRCSMPYCIKYFNELFSYSITTEDLIDIYDDGISGIKLKAAFRKPIEICRYCANPEWVDWESGSRSDAKIEDWCASSHL